MPSCLQDLEQTLTICFTALCFDDALLWVAFDFAVPNLLEAKLFVANLQTRFRRIAVVVSGRDVGRDCEGEEGWIARNIRYCLEDRGC